MDGMDPWTNLGGAKNHPVFVKPAINWKQSFQWVSNGTGRANELQNLMKGVAHHMADSNDSPSSCKWNAGWGGGASITISYEIHNRYLH